MTAIPSMTFHLLPGKKQRSAVDRQRPIPDHIQARFRHRCYGTWRRSQPTARLDARPNRNSGRSVGCTDQRQTSRHWRRSRNNSFRDRSCVLVLQESLWAAMISHRHEQRNQTKKGPAAAELEIGGHARHCNPSCGHRGNRRAAKPEDRGPGQGRSAGGAGESGSLPTKAASQHETRCDRPAVSCETTKPSPRSRRYRAQLPSLPRTESAIQTTSGGGGGHFLRLRNSTSPTVRIAATATKVTSGETSILPLPTSVLN